MLAPRKTLHSTPLCVFRRALELVNASPRDVLYDLGCGDGRLVVAAAKEFGLRAVGVEIDAQRAQLAASKAAKAGVDHLVTIHCANALEFDVPRDATIVFLFLIDRGLSLIRPKLERAAHDGLRVVTYLYRFPGVVPDAKHFVPAKEGALAADVAFPLFIYRFPLTPAVQRIKQLPDAAQDDADEGESTAFSPSSSSSASPVSSSAATVHVFASKSD